MNPRDTRTGGVLEQMIYPAMTRGGYTFHTQMDVGRRFGGGVHKIDMLAEKDGRRYLISLKWQQVSGTAEQKLPYELMCLIRAKREGNFNGAYIVMGGSGWSLREFYQTLEFKTWIRDSHEVNIITLEDFIAKANNGKL